MKRNGKRCVSITSNHFNVQHIKKLHHHTHIRISTTVYFNCSYYSKNTYHTL